MNKKERVMTPERIEEVLDYLRRKMTESIYFETEFSRGVETTYPFGGGFVNNQLNGTETIVIKINGGARDTEVMGNG